MKRIGLLVICAGVAACGSSNKYALKLQNDAYVQVGDAAAELKAQGESVEVGNEPVYVSYPGHIAALVIPVREELGEVEGELARVEER